MSNLIVRASIIDKYTLNTIKQGKYELKNNILYCIECSNLAKYTYKNFVDCTYTNPIINYSHYKSGEVLSAACCDAHSMVGLVKYFANLDNISKL